MDLTRLFTRPLDLRERSDEVLPSMGEWTWGRRAQGSVIGVVLVFGIVIAGSTLTIALGAEAVSSTQGQLSNERAQQTMTQLDSQAAMVALGSTERQEVSLPKSNADGYRVAEDAGWMNVSYNNKSGHTKEVFNETMGAIVYENEQKTVAYQGGGVWRNVEGGSSLMVSPPEFHYRDATLTLPLVTVRGNSALNQRAQITHNSTTQHFPDQATDDEFRNPVEGTEINVTVRSKYYEAWGNYFETRTEGNVTYDHATNTARITLVPPFDEAFDNVVATTRQSGITVNGNDDPPSPYEQGVNYPAVDSRIEEQIDDCSPSGTCNTFNGSIDDDGVYYSGSDYSGELDVNDPDGNVTIVVDGSFEFDDDVTITNLDPDHSITIYVRNDFVYSEKDGFDSGAEADDLRVLVHSDGDVDGNGNAQFVGLLYAPQSNCDLNGNNNVTGGLICETMDINGNPNDFQYDSSLEDVRLGLSAENITRLQYLHVTTNEINVTER
jgi:hypothetical protein